MKINLRKGMTFEQASKFRCKGRNPAPGVPFCFRVKGEGSGPAKRHVIEFWVGGKRIGFQDSGCRLVYDRVKAQEFNSDGRVVADFVARHCMAATNSGRKFVPEHLQARASMKALREAAKKAATASRKPKPKSRK